MNSISRDKKLLILICLKSRHLLLRLTSMEFKEFQFLKLNSNSEDRKRQNLTFKWINNKFQALNSNSIDKALMLIYLNFKETEAVWLFLLYRKVKEQWKKHKFKELISKEKKQISTKINLTWREPNYKKLKNNWIWLRCRNHRKILRNQKFKEFKKIFKDKKFKNHNSNKIELIYKNHNSIWTRLICKEYKNRELWLI